jgi:hypothetical protein
MTQTCNHEDNSGTTFFKKNVTSHYLHALTTKLQYEHQIIKNKY